MKSRKIGLTFLTLILILSVISIIPIDNTYAYTGLEEYYDWKYNNIEHRQVFYQHDMWESGYTNTLVIAYRNSSSVYLAWYNIDTKAQPNTEFEPYMLQYVPTLHLGFQFSLIEYIDDKVLLVVASYEGVSTYIEWYSCYAFNSTYSNSTRISDVKLLSSGLEENIGMSNIVKLGNKYWVSLYYIYVSNTVRFNTCSHVGDVYYDDTLFSYTAEVCKNDYMILVTGQYLGSTSNRLNELYILCVDKEVIYSTGVVIAVNSNNGTHRKISGVYSDFPSPENTYSANYVSCMGLDYGDGFIGSIVYSFKDEDGDLKISAIKFVDNYASASYGYDTETYVGAGGLNPAGCYDDLGSDSSDFLSRIVYDETYKYSKITIDTYCFGLDTITLETSKTTGYFGDSITDNLQLEYWKGRYYRIEVDYSYYLHVYATTVIEAQPPPIDYIYTTVGAINPDGTNETYTGLTTYMYLVDLQNIAQTKLSEIGFGFSGNATDIATYKVGLGIYYASNMQTISMSNPLTLIFTKEYTYTGQPLGYKTITDYPNINIPKNSIVAIAYSSTVDLCVNKTVDVKHLYSLQGYLPSNAGFVYDEGNVGIVLYAKFLSQSVGEGAEDIIVGDAPYTIDIVGNIIGLSSWLGMSSSIFGMLLWCVTVFGALLLITKLSSNIPSVVYVVILVGITFVYQGIGLIPIWFTVIMSLCIVGVSALAFSKVVSGEG